MMRMFSGMGMNGQGAGEGFMPMMQGMMKTLLSKEVLYPSLKEINDKVKFQKTSNNTVLTHISLAFCFWDIGKQYSPRISVVISFSPKKIFCSYLGIHEGLDGGSKKSLIVKIFAP